MTRRTLLSLLPAGALEASSASAVGELPNPAGRESGHYRLTTLSDGTAALCWLEPGTERSLLWSRFDGRSWSTPLSIARSGDLLLNWADFPSLCPLPGGRMAAHWLVRHPVEKFATSIRFGHSTDGGRSWRTIFQAGEQLTSDYAGFASLTPLPDGFGAAYLAPPDGVAAPAGHGDHEEHRKTLRWVEFDPDGRLRRDQEVDSDACSCCQTAVVSTASGPLVAYRDHQDDIRDVSILSRTAGTWSKPRRLHADDWRISACPVNGPSLSVSGKQVAAAWYTGAADQPRVYLAFSADSGERFQKPVRLDDGRPLGRACVSWLKDGTAVAGWIGRTAGGSSVLRVRRATPSGAAGPSIDVAEVGAGRASGFPSLVPLGDQLLVAWRTARVQTGLLPVPPLG